MTAMTAKTMLAVHDVRVTFGDVHVLHGVDLEVDRGEVLALLGASGSGKSTLLRVIAGLLVADAGSVELDGRDVTAVPTHRRGVGLLFQDDQLFPHRDVAGNVGFGLEMDHRPRERRRARVSELLSLVGLDGFGTRHVNDLSGGEAKRVALARALAIQPKVLLLDEPLTGLDRELHDRLAIEVSGILHDTGTTSVWVTHDVEEARTVADRVVTLDELQR